MHDAMTALARVTFDGTREEAAVILHGEIDYAAATVLSDALAAAGALSDRVIVDVADVTFLSSHNVGEVLVLAEPTDRHRVVFRGASGTVARVLEHWRVTDVPGVSVVR